MKKKTAFRLFALATCSFLLISWGFCIGRYEAFPFSTVKQIKNWLMSYEADDEFIVVNKAVWQHDVSHFRNLHATPDIVMLGDSITAGAEWNEIFPGKRIANRGIGGDTTDGILQRLDEVLAKKPKTVFVLAGINDLGLGRSVDLIFEDYKQIVKSLRDAEIEVIVQSTIVPSRSVAVERRHQVSALNVLLREFCIETNVRFVDLNETLANNGALASEYTFDGVHLNGVGYALWADVIGSFIDQSESGNREISSTERYPGESDGQ